VIDGVGGSLLATAMWGAPQHHAAGDPVLDPSEGAFAGVSISYGDQMIVVSSLEAVHPIVVAGLGLLDEVVDVTDQATAVEA